MPPSQSEIPWTTGHGSDWGTRITLPATLGAVRVVLPLCWAKPAPWRPIIVIAALSASVAACSGGQGRDGLDGDGLARGVKEVMQN